MIVDQVIDVRYLGPGTDDEPPQEPEANEVALAYQSGVDCVMAEVVAGHLLKDLFERYRSGEGLPGPLQFTVIARVLEEAAAAAIQQWERLSCGSRHYFMLRWTKIG